MLWALNVFLVAGLVAFLCMGHWDLGAVCLTFLALAWAHWWRTRPGPPPLVDDRLAGIFALVVREVFSAGGDGDGVVVFAKTPVPEAAAAFEAWQRQHVYLSRWPYVRLDITEDHVLFSDQRNENITFVSKQAGALVRTGMELVVWLEVA